MTRALAALGVDARQFVALVRVAVKLDLRTGTPRDASRPTRGGGRPLLLMLAYALAGGWVALFIAPAETFFSASLFHLTALALIVGIMVVLEFNSIVLSADDFQILGPQPVTSTTVFFARLAHALLYTHALGFAFSLAPLCVLGFWMQGFQPRLGAVAVLATSASIVVVTLVGVACYAGIVRFVRPRRMRAVLSWSQLGFSLLVYSAFLLVRRRSEIGALPAWSFETTPGLLLLPSSWFAAWVDLAERGISALGLTALALSLVSGLAWMTFAATVLSRTYARRLLALRDVRDGDEGRRRGRGLLFRSGEARVIGLLVPSQFRHDYRFRLGVLGVLPLTLLYLVIGLEEGPPADPFVVPQLTQGSALLYLAVLISPALLVPSFVYSDAHAAGWLYDVTPVDRSRLVLAARNFIVVGFMAPYLACIAALLAYLYGSLWHALAHVAVLGLCSGLFLLLAMLFNPGLPFTRPVQRGAFSMRTLVPFALAPLFAFGGLPLLLRFGYGSVGATLLCLVGLTLANVLVGRWVAGRISA